MNSNVWLPLTEPLQASRDTVHVVRLTLEADDYQLERLKMLLSSDESARADRYKVPLPRRHFIICRAILRLLFGECLGCNPRDVEFDYGPHGKPDLRQTSAHKLRFSVSHSANQALIATTLDRSIGVDIERIDPGVRILKLAQRFFSSREATELSTLDERDQLAGFFQGWTSKEAYLKATGFGLSFPLNRFSVSLNPHQPARLIEVVDQPTELTRWHLLRLDPLPGFAAAIMLDSCGDSVNLQQWTVEPGLLA